MFPIQSFFLVAFQNIINFYTLIELVSCWFKLKKIQINIYLNLTIIIMIKIILGQPESRPPQPFECRTPHLGVSCRSYLWTIYTNANTVNYKTQCHTVGLFVIFHRHTLNPVWFHRCSGCSVNAALETEEGADDSYIFFFFRSCFCKNVAGGHMQQSQKPRSFEAAAVIKICITLFPGLYPKIKVDLYIYCW